jgi:hypothetical protein
MAPEPGAEGRHRATDRMRREQHEDEGVQVLRPARTSARSISCR